MAGALSQTLRLVIAGDSKGAVNALKGVEKGTSKLASDAENLRLRLEKQRIEHGKITKKIKAQGDADGLLTNKMKTLAHEIGVGEAKLKGLDRELAESTRKTSRWGSGWKKGAKVALAGLGGLAAGAASVVAIGNRMIGQTKDYMSPMIRLQRQTGLNSEAVSVLAGQLRLSGIELSRAEKGITIFNRTLYAARTGTKSSEEAFAALGVSIRNQDGSFRDMSDVLADVRNAISKIEDPTKRSALALKLFGRGGAEMLPWLTKSQTEMDKYTKTIKAMGIFTEKDFATYKQFAGNQRLMAYFFDMLKVKAGLFAMKLMNEVYPRLVEMYEKYGPKVKAAFEAMWRGMQSVWKIIGPLVSQFGKLAPVLAGLLVAAKVAKGFAAMKTTMSVLGFGKLITGAGDATGKLGGLRSILGRVRTSSGSLAGMLGKGGALGIALAFTTTTVLGAVDAWKQYRAAVKQAGEAADDAGSNLVKQFKAGKLSKKTARRDALEIIRDAYDIDDKARLVKLFHEAGIPGFAKGGDFITRGATPILVGEAGPERVTITPLSKRGATGTGDIYLSLTVPIYQQGAVIGEASQVGEAIGKLVVPHLRKLARAGAF